MNEEHTLVNVPLIYRSLAVVIKVTHLLNCGLLFCNAAQIGGEKHCNMLNWESTVGDKVVC